MGALPLLLDDPTIASKRWVYEQYDSTVQGTSVLRPGGDAGVFLVPGETFGVAVAVDCNQRYVALDPYQGGKAAVAEAARNVACTGALPLGITDCLNFGNPDKPAVFFQFREACRGIGEACRVFDTPVTGGNVSLYNENPKGAIDPTPVIGMVGLLSDVRRRVPSHFQAPGDLVVLLGLTRGHLGASAYWEVVRGFTGGPPPPIDLPAERQLQRFLVAAAGRGLLRSAHDCSDGGLAVALAECCIGGPYAEAPLGAWIEITRAEGAPEAVLYGEDGARVIITCRREILRELRLLASEFGIPAHGAGEVGAPGGPLEIRMPGGSPTFAWRTGELRRIYFDAIPRRMEAGQSGALSVRPSARPSD
jgi:phosphoribosylformylglycinamidine synthase